MAVALLLFLYFSSVLSALNNLGQKPYQGWSSWSLSAIKNSPTYGGNWLSEANVQQQSDAMVKLLQAYGYNYINIDSFWAADPTQQVDEYGRWTTNLDRFPSGFSGVASYVHNNNQRIGIYLNPGIAKAAVNQNTPILNTTCHAKDIALMPLQNGNVFGDTYAVNFSHPCAQPYFDSFAAQLAEWGVDFLKLDAVSPGSDSTSYDNRPDVEAWAKALVNSGRDIWFTISWHIDVSYASFWQQYANAWRVEDDVECYCNTLVSWYSVVKRFADVQAWLPYAGAGSWNDLDSIDAGNGTISGLNDDERRSYVTFWAISAAPFYTGNDLTQLDTYGLSLLTNSDVIAVNQLGIPAVPTKSTASGDLQVWYLAHPNGGAVVGLFNLGSSPSQISFSWADVGVPPSSQYTATDIWNATTLGQFSGQYTSPLLNSHASQLILLS